jgi:molybdopterin-guanine dinucleotide biosynthesis protein B
LAAIYGIVGHKDSGKTHLIVRLVRAATARGLRVATIKHAHHAFDIDHPGKDSYLHREAGAAEVLVASAQRWALMHEHCGAPEPSLDDLLAQLAPCDLVLVEGFKSCGHPKLEVYRAACGQPPLAPMDSSIEAVAMDSATSALEPGPFVRLPLDATETVLDFILARARPAQPPSAGAPAK